MQTMREQQLDDEYNNNLKRAEQRLEDELRAAEDRQSALSILSRHSKELMENKHFCLLLAAFSIGLAVFNGLLTVIDQWLSPFGYSEGQSGIAGGTLILSGLVGAAAAGVLLDSYHCYRSLLKGCFVCAFFALIFMCAMLREDNYPLLLFSFAAMGFFTLPILPGIIENAVECTHPVPEESSSGLLFGCGNVLGIGVTLLLAEMVKTTKNHPYTRANIFLVGCIAACVLILIPYKGEYKRLKSEKTGDLGDRHLSGNSTTRGGVSALNESLLLSGDMA